MNLPFKVSSISTNLGLLSFLRRHLLAIFLVVWLAVVAGVIGFVYHQINQELNAPLPLQQSAEFKVEQLNSDLFSDKSDIGKLFLNLRTLAVTPIANDYEKCLGVPGRPHIFTPFVPCP